MVIGSRASSITSRCHRDNVVANPSPLMHGLSRLFSRSVSSIVAGVASSKRTTLSSRPSGETGRADPRPTMREVAALAGVSIKTVSRVVNEEPGVSALLVGRVGRAAEQLDYRPNLTASSLRRADRRTGTVGLLLEDVANPFSSAVHRAFGDAAGQRGVAVLATSLDEDPQREREFAHAMMLRRVDGLAIMPTGTDQSYLRNDMRAGLALVFVDRPPAFLDADVVLATNREGARDGVRHLVATGHRRIAFLSDLQLIATARERYLGYRDALRAAGLTLDERIVRTELHTREAAEAAAMELLGLPTEVAPTAIFASQNLVAIGTVRALRRLGLQHEIALVGFDDFELADLLDPGVTVVAADPFEIGAIAAELLFARLDGDRGPSRHRRIPTRLIVRGSGEIGPRVPAVA
jgi:LacI family transcriptional regulator